MPILSTFTSLSILRFKKTVSNIMAWFLETKITPTPNWNAIYSVATSNDGNTSIIGGDTVVGNGAVSINVRNGTVWSEEAMLPFVGCGRVQSVSLTDDGNMLVIGCPTETINSVSLRGAVYVFTRSGSTWTQQAKLIASDGQYGSYFGGDVSVSAGNIIVVSNGINPTTGLLTVYVFTRSGSTWTEQTKLLSGTTNEWFGGSLCISSDENTIVVGSPNSFQAPSPLATRGSVYIFIKNGTTWTQQVKLSPPDVVIGASFGDSVSINSNGTIVSIGAPGQTINNTVRRGSVYVYVKNNNIWTREINLIANDGLINDGFGKSNSMSDDGKTIVIGSNPASDTLRPGSAYIFTKNIIGWSEQTKLTAFDGVKYSNFGFSVDIDGDGNTVIVGKFQFNWSAATPNGAYIYVLRFP